MFRIITVCTFIFLSACDQSNNTGATQETISSNKLTGTWAYKESNDVIKTFHLAGSEDSIIKTDCSSKNLSLFHNQNNILLEESGREYWNIKDTESLYRGNEVAVKLDSEETLTFGTLSIKIGESDPNIFNTIVDTTNFCSELNQNNINIYVKDNNDFKATLLLTNSNIIGSNSVELGELLTQFIWKDRATKSHIEWLDSGTLNCSFSIDNDLVCKLEGVLVLSGSFIANFTILEKHLPGNVLQLIPR